MTSQGRSTTSSGVENFQPFQAFPGPQARSTCRCRQTRIWRKQRFGNHGFWFPSDASGFLISRPGHRIESRCGFRVSRSGFRISRVGFRISRVGFRINRVGFRIMAGFRFSRSGYRFFRPPALMPRQNVSLQALVPPSSLNRAGTSSIMYRHCYWIGLPFVRSFVRLHSRNTPRKS